MRTLGSCLVVGALLLSGGVSVGAGSDRATAEIGQTPAPPEQEICSAPRRVYVPPNPLAAALRDARTVIDLNTRGYNYLRPDEYRPAPPKAPREAVPAAPASE